jgi:hypothetical protein
LDDLEFHRRIKERAQVPKNGIFVPFAQLGEIIQKWNSVIDYCEEKFLDPHMRHGERYGISGCCDLSKYRRSMPICAEEDGLL